MKKLLVGLFAAFLCLTLVGCANIKFSDDEEDYETRMEREYNSYKATQNLNSHAIEVDAKTISNVYYNNKLDGNKKYFGKRIKSSGKFTSADKDSITGWSVILDTGERYDYYCTSFVDGEERAFSNYNRGQKLIVYGEVDELIGSYLRLKDCDLERN